MYTSYIGKKFLELYNQRMGTHHSARVFFDEVFFPLFFHNDSHLMHVGNSPFFQKPKAVDVNKHGGKALAQLQNLHSAVASQEPNMSIFVGYGAKDVKGTTTGQVTTMSIDIEDDDVYASWLGQALAIGVNGGYVMLIDEEEILWMLYRGWEQYRIYYSQTPNIKDKQIETWNGQWLAHAFSTDFVETNPRQGLHIETTTVQNKISIPTIKWSQIVFTLSRKYPNHVITSYAYNLSQTNTTLGFINIYLPEVNKYYFFRDQIFIDKSESGLTNKEITQLETFYNFENACKLGHIGLKALEPRNLRNFMPRGLVDYAKGSKMKFDTVELINQYNLFKIWIIAMLNKTELLDLATRLANALVSLESQKNRGKTVHKNQVKDLLDSKYLKLFIEKLTSVLEKDGSNADTYRDVLQEVLTMPTDNFPLFVALVSFEYQYIKSKK